MARALLFLFLCACSSLFAQTGDYRFDHVDLRKVAGEQRLGILGIDSSGKVWFNIEKGIAVYDGYLFRKFVVNKKDSNSLRDSYVTTTYLASDGKVWVGYYDAAVSVFDPRIETWKHYLHDSTSAESLPPGAISRFRETGDGGMFVMTWGAGFAEMNTQNGKCKRYFPIAGDSTSLSSTRIKEIVHDKGDVWLVGSWEGDGLENRLQLFNRKTGKFSVFPLAEYLENLENPQVRWWATMCTRIVHSIYIDERDNLWIASYSGLLYLDRYNKKARRISSTSGSNAGNLENTRSITPMPNGKLIVGTTHSGVLIVDPANLTCISLRHNFEHSFGLSDDRIRGVVVDPFNNILISTSSGVIDVWAPVRQSFRIISNEVLKLDNNDRSAEAFRAKDVVADGEGKFYAGSASGVSVFDLDKNQMLEVFKSHEHYKAPKGDSSWLVGVQTADEMVLMKDYLIATSRNGMWSRNLKTGEVKFQGVDKGRPMLRVFHRKGQDYVSVVTYIPTITIFHYYPESDSLVEAYAFDFKRIVLCQAVTEIDDEKFVSGWFPEEFYLADGKTGKFKMFHKDSANHFPDSTLLSIQVDKRNKVWVCTQNGLYLFDSKTEKFEYYNPKLGLGQEAVLSVTLDNKDEYWIALENSLLRYNEKSGKIFRYGSEFGCNPGMFGLRPAYVDERNMLYYITLKGIMVIDPNDLNLNVDPPQLQFSRITNSGDTLVAVQLREWLSKPVALPYNKNFFTFEWSTNQVFTISPHRFEYRLIGLDSTWTDNGISNKISFTNLSPGNYTFEVRGQNAYGASSDVLRFSFFIDRPFYSKWWFILLVVLALGTLVFAYMKFRERQLQEAKLRLEKTVEERTEEVREKAREVLHQKEIIEEKNKELTSSIVYAQRIQEAILPEDKMLQEVFPDSFVLFKPKDIVSGDFPWMCRTKNYFFWAVADCTGHGVPGGFMSMLGNSLLNQIVAEQGISEPGKILDELRERIMRSLKQSGADGETRDGMDICLCRMDLSTRKIVFAGANNSIYLVRNSELREFRGNKQPIGIHMAEMHPFSQQEFEVYQGDCLYAFSDGYADQFGGEKGKKFKYSRFEELILREHANPMINQSEVYWNTFETWRGDFEQVDDVCVIGVRV